MLTSMVSAVLIFCIATYYYGFYRTRIALKSYKFQKLKDDLALYVLTSDIKKNYEQEIKVLNGVIDEYICFVKHDKPYIKTRMEQIKELSNKSRKAQQKLDAMADECICKILNEPFLAETYNDMEKLVKKYFGRRDKIIRIYFQTQIKMLLFLINMFEKLSAEKVVEKEQVCRKFSERVDNTKVKENVFEGLTRNL